ncbi:efflux RND transporter periplasmic adaptor subunit [Rhodobacterales bacterium HKCCE2091]|nr:efflux RND transporter periplasmic adaptor subunit [Rhodobacterales bacterium HKCCE2091]
MIHPPETRSGRPLRAAAAVAALLALLGAGGAAAQGMAGPGMGPAQVGVVTVQAEQVPYTSTVPGRAVAYEEVDIRPRVSGAISEIVYTPGTAIAAGDVLFRIESETYAADVAAAEAEVARAEAAVSSAEATRSRYERLEGTGVTVEDVESARVAVLQAQADLSAANAALQAARLDLDRTEIVSPIAGYAALPEVSVGALVTANQADALTTVTRLDPIYVDVEESSRRIGDVRRRIDAGSIAPGETLGISLVLETGETYSGEGEMVSPGTSVSPTTGTIAIRIRFDNPDRRIIPGQFLRVEVVLGSVEAVLVPQGATSRASDGSLTAFVAVDGRAEQRVLAEDGSYRNGWIVTGGIEAGEALIVDGLSNLRDGAEIAPVAVAISADGVVTEAGDMDGAPPPGDGGVPAADGN